MKDCTNNITEKLESEFSAKTAAILTGQCESEDVNKIIDLIDYKNSELTFKLPVKPFSYVWIISQCRYIDLPATTQIPDGCSGIYSEACLECKYCNKECTTVGYPEEKWFYLDSPILTTVINEWGKTVFETEEECLNACKKLYNSELVEKCSEQYHNFRLNLINKE